MCVKTVKLMALHSIGRQPFEALRARRLGIKPVSGFLICENSLGMSCQKA